MSLSRLKWLTALGLVGFVLVLDLVRTSLSTQVEDTGMRLLMGALVILGAAFLLGLVFHFIGRLHQRLEARNAELLALHRAALDIAGELDLEAVLQKVVDGARQLLDARFGALAVYDASNRIESFLVSGISTEERARIGSPPVGRGILGLVLERGETIRLRNLARHPRSAGFPPHHPRMTSLLAVPINCTVPMRGNLYLANKLGAPEFSDEDEQTLGRFATQAALAVDTAHLHGRLRGLAVAEERLRIAHEMHDGLAQVLASVNAGAQAVREYLRTGRTAEAAEQLDRLAASARGVYGEVREGILALRAAAGGPDRPVAEILREYMIQWQDQTGIMAHVMIDEDIEVPPAAELQVVRIAQEALANVRKHARASSVVVELVEIEGDLSLVVADDGRGFEPDGASTAGGTPRFGLATMRERAQSIGGKLGIESTPGKGTRVALQAPLRKARTAI